MVLAKADSYYPSFLIKKETQTIQTIMLRVIKSKIVFLYFRDDITS